MQPGGESPVRIENVVTSPTMTLFKTVLAAGLLSVVSLHAAESSALWLPSMFSDRMVLQQGKPVPVWGKASPGEKVTVAFAGQTVSATADGDGKWKAELAPLKANKVDADLTVTAGGQTKTIHNVVVGEVWMLSGQSNMAFLMSAILRTPEIVGGESRKEAATKGKGPSQIKAEADIAKANDPLLRAYRVDNISAERPREDAVTNQGWMVWDTKNAPNFAAMAYYFAEKLRAKLDVPVGILQCSWGGSGASSWVSPATLRSPALNTFWPEDVPDWVSNIAPGRLYNGMVKPLAPYAISGFAWYQGETEATDHMNAYLYRYLLKALIGDWRHAWHDNNLPFYVVQLPPLNNGQRWEVVRDSQSFASNEPKTTMIPTLDIVPPGDLHPKVKYKVADRLADAVLGTVYKQDAWKGYPSFDKSEAAGEGAIKVTLKNAAGLKTMDGAAPAEFQVAGEDRVFKAAEAKIEGDTVVVKSAEVAKPVAVRYAFVQSPKVNVANGAGLPLVPFRTDDWPITGQEYYPQQLPVKGTLADVVTGGALGENKAAPWVGSPALTDKAVAEFFVSAGKNRVSVAGKGFPPRPNVPPSPAIYWTAEPAIDPAKGLTFEVSFQLNEAGNPIRGMDIEAGVKQADGSLRKYLVTTLLTRIYTFQNFLGGRVSESALTRLLRSDLDATSRVMRLAIRPDGIAQIYDNGKLIGTTSGVIVPDSKEKSYLKFGKTIDYGTWSASISGAGFDLSGAFAPPADQAAPKAERGGSDEE